MKKIVHICEAVFTDEMAYQDNLLPKYHAKLGYAVTVITSTWKYNTKGGFFETTQCDYINQDGVHVKRLSLRGRNDFKGKFRSLKGLYKALCNEKPNILFVHGCQYVDISVITKYIKNFHVQQVFVDNHADFFNSATNWLSKNILHKVIWKHYAHVIEPYVKRFFGVLPARVDFLTDVYQLPKEKCKLLVMGADDEQVESAKARVDETREKYGINKSDFLIVTGGKIDRHKWQIILLEKAIIQMGYLNIKLIIFGSISEELKEKVMEMKIACLIQRAETEHWKKHIK